MISYEKSKQIAVDKAKQYNVVIDKAYKLKDAFVFENSKDDIVGVLPIVVDKEGVCHGLWQYINDNNLTMDDMIECEF